MSTFVHTFLRLCVKSPEQDSSKSSQIRTKLNNKSIDEIRHKSSRLTENYDLLGGQLISDYMNREIWNKALRQLQRHDQCTGSKDKRKKERIRQRLICGANNKLKERNDNNTLTIPKPCFNSFTHVNVSQQFPETPSNVNEETLRHSQLNEPVFNLFVYLAREGVKINGLFRRPGNIADMKNILLDLSKGISVNWSDYNIYTVANVAKRFLICLPHGIFGMHGENLLLRTARMRCSSVYENSGILSTKLSITPEDRIRLEAFCNVVNSLPAAKKELAILTFGILYNMVENVNTANIIDNLKTDDNQESCKENSNSGITVSPEKLTIAEGIAKSVAGSLFHSCAHAVSEVDNATIIITSLLLNFSCLPKELISIYEDAVSGKLMPLKGEKYQNNNSPDDDSIMEDENNNFSMKQNFKVYAERLLCLSSHPSNKLKKSQLSDCSNVKRSHHHQLLCHTKSGDKASFSSYTKASFEMSSDARDSSVSILMNQLAFQKQNYENLERSEKSTQTSILKMSKQNSKNESFESNGRSTRPIHISSVNWHESVDEAESSTILINFAPSVQLKSRPSLVRRHSRYKSIQRRQMATLALKSAWFLAEQPIPVICLPDDFEIQTHSRKSSEKSAKQMLNSEDKLSTVSLIDINDHEQDNYQNQLECSIHLTASAIEMMMYSTNEISPNQYDEDKGIDDETKFNAFLQPCPSLLSLQSAPDKFDNSSDLFIDLLGFNLIRPYTWPSTFEKGLANCSLRDHSDIENDG